jgi:hypothetical protein
MVANLYGYKCWTAVGLLFIFLMIASVGCGECQTDYDCDGLRTCDVESGECSDVECRAAQDCAPAELCSANRCVPAKESTPPGVESAVSLPTESADAMAVEDRNEVGDDAE